MAARKRIGILTGGGDVPGLNPVIKSAVYRASEIGWEVLGIRRGWEGLTHVNVGAAELDERYIRPLTRENTRTIDRTGGTILHTSRTNPRKFLEKNLPSYITPEQLKKLPFDGKYYDLTAVVLDNLERLGIGCLIAIGGDDTLSFASALSASGFPLIAIPKTMDNDVQGTEYCIGFSTAITRAKESITRQRTTLGSHERIGIFRIFGRDAGFTALYVAYVTSTRCLIPEFPFDLDHVCALLMEDKQKNPSNYSLIVVSEGAVWTQGTVAEYGEADAYGHRKKVDIGHALGRGSSPANQAGNDGQRFDLRPPQRRARRNRQNRRHHLRQYRARLDSRWRHRPHGGDSERLLRPGFTAEFSTGRAQSGHRKALQHGSLSPALFIKAWRTASLRQALTMPSGK